MGQRIEAGGSRGSSPSLLLQFLENNLKWGEGVQGDWCYGCLGLRGQWLQPEGSRMERKLEVK